MLNKKPQKQQCRARSPAAEHRPVCKAIQPQLPTEWNSTASEGCDSIYLELCSAASKFSVVVFCFFAVYFLIASPVTQPVKNLSGNAGDARDAGSSPGSGRSPGEGKWQPTPVFLRENDMGRGAWRATVHAVSKSRTRLKQLTLIF